MAATFAAISTPQQVASAAKQFEQLRADLRKAREQKDWQSYLSNSQKLNEFQQGAPVTHLQLALAQWHIGDHRKALEEVWDFIHMGQTSEIVTTSADFADLRAEPGFNIVSEAMARNQTPIENSGVAFEISEIGLVPEDIDYDPLSSQFFITSVQKKKIITMKERGKAHDFVHSPDSWPMLAIKIDARRRLLWATEVALDGFNAVPASDWGRSAVLCYDLRTGKLVQRMEGPAHSALGDAVLTKDGHLIVSDGEGGGVYLAQRGSKELKRLDDGDFISPQTPAMHPDGQHVFVPDYVRGIGILDLKTRHVQWIPMADRYALNGIDGLYFEPGGLIAVQNGTSPERVSAFRLDSDLSRVTAELEIERATPTLGDPTHGVIVHHQFYYIANSGWDTLDEHGNPKASAKPTPAYVKHVIVSLGPTHLD